MPEEKAEIQEPEIQPADTGIRDAISEALDAETETAEEASESAVESEATDEQDEAEKGDPVEEADETTESVEGASEETDGEDEDSGEEALDAPAHWALEDQEMFRGVDAKVQKWLLGRSKDMEAAHTKRSQEIAPLRTAIEKHKPYLDSISVTPEIAFETLITAERTLRTGTDPQKRAAILKLAHDYGISVEEPKANGAAQEDFLTADIRKAVEPLQQEVGTLRQSILQREQLAQQAQAEKLAEEVRLFREAKTEAGQPAHPYFDEARDEMARLAQADTVAGRTSDINDLYDRAIHADPTVRAKLQAAQQHAAKLKEKHDRKEKVKKSKAAGVSVTGVSSAPKEQPKSLRDTIVEAAAGGL